MHPLSDTSLLDHFDSNEKGSSAEKTKPLKKSQSFLDINKAREEETEEGSLCTRRSSPPKLVNDQFFRIVAGAT
jgi:hypothetical protein